MIFINIALRAIGFESKCFLSHSTAVVSDLVGSVLSIFTYLRGISS